MRSGGRFGASYQGAPLGAPYKHLNDCAFSAAAWFLFTKIFATKDFSSLENLTPEEVACSP